MTCPICLRPDLPDAPCHECQVLSDQAAARAAQVASNVSGVVPLVPLPDVDPLAFEAASRWDEPPKHMADEMDRFIAEAKALLNARDQQKPYVERDGHPKGSRIDRVSRAEIAVAKSGHHWHGHHRNGRE